MSKNEIVEILDLVNVKDIVDFFSQQHDCYYRGVENSSWRIKTSIDVCIEKVNSTGRTSLLDGANQDSNAEIRGQVNFLKRHDADIRKVLKYPPDRDVTIDGSNFAEIQVILQHFGYPTRLCDWTESWKKALYFACKESTKIGVDSVVWVIKKPITDLMVALKDETNLYEASMFKYNILDRFYNRLVPGIYLVDRPIFRRIQAQDGVLLSVGRADMSDFQDQLLNDANLGSSIITKVIIEKGEKDEINAFLASEGISEKNLFPEDIVDVTEDAKAECIQFLIDLYPQIDWASWGI
jgi:hypothetical protein